MISTEILRRYHAVAVPLRKGEMIFQQGDEASSFYIVKSGKIKMCNYSDDGREFVQGYFTEAQSFGEPPFFSHGKYPASAIATEPSEIWKIRRENFLLLLRENFDIQLSLLQALCARLVYKSTMLSELAIEEAEHRLMTLLHYLALQARGTSSDPVKISLTRQQLADMAGLRVETVIRSIKSLEQQHQLRIDDDGKIIVR